MNTSAILFLCMSRGSDGPLASRFARRDSTGAASGGRASPRRSRQTPRGVTVAGGGKPVSPEVQPVSTGLRAEALLQILEVTRKLAAPFDLVSVLAEIGEAARSVLRAERATVWLYEPEQAQLVLTGGDGTSRPVRASLSQ